jgi:prepilin-type N-terminal cleavage/methylation domain-containing protein
MLREDPLTSAKPLPATRACAQQKPGLMAMATSSKSGFTLVELMLVVGLVGLLAAITIPSFVLARAQSQAKACINNLRQIDDAAQEWALDNRQAPAATVSFPDVQPYLKGAVICPSAGSDSTFADSYTMTTVSNKPVCNLVPTTHVLPPDSSQSGPVHPVAPF